MNLYLYFYINIYFTILLISMYISCINYNTIFLQYKSITFNRIYVAIATLIVIKYDKTEVTNCEYTQYKS